MGVLDPETLFFRLCGFWPLQGAKGFQMFYYSLGIKTAILDGRDRAIVIAESLARVTAAIRIASVRSQSYLQGPLNGGVSNGGVSRSGRVLPFLSFFVLFCPFWDFPDFSGIFPICSGMVRGFSRFVPFLFLGLLRAPTRNSPERVRDTIWTFPEKSGKHPGLETPRFSFCQYLLRKHRKDFSQTLRSLCCDWNRAIGVHSLNSRSTWNCGMACKSWPRGRWTLAIGDRQFCPSKMASMEASADRSAFPVSQEF